jgi:hypothetical protein
MNLGRFDASGGLVHLAVCASPGVGELGLGSSVAQKPASEEWLNSAGPIGFDRGDGRGNRSLRPHVLSLEVEIAMGIPARRLTPETGATPLSKRNST